MAKITIREIPSKMKEVKKEKPKEDEESEEEQASLEAIINELKSRAASRPQMTQAHTRAVNPVLKQQGGGIAQIVSGPQVPRTTNSETQKDSRPVVYEGREKSKYEASPGSSERKYNAPNAERKYDSSSTPGSKEEQSRRVSPVLGDTNPGNSAQRGIFGTPQEQRGIQSSDNGSKRDYEVNPFAENNDKRRSRRL